MSRHIPDNRRIQTGVQRGKSFEIEVNGEKVLAYEGETIAAALLAAGKRIFRKTVRKGEPRGAFCGMGICYDCMMIVNGQPYTRVCQTLATPFCKVETQIGLEDWEEEK